MTGKDVAFERNAMLLCPLIRSGVISHERVAEILAINKWDPTFNFNQKKEPGLKRVTIDGKVLWEETL